MEHENDIMTIDKQQESLWDILRKLKEDSGNNITACAIISVEGLPIESHMPTSEMENEPKLAAMTAAMVSLGVTAGIQFSMGSFEEIYVESEYGWIIARQAGAAACVVALCNKEAKLGIVKLSLKNVAQRVGMIIS